MIPGNINALLLGEEAAAGGYQIQRSLRFNSADSAYLSRTPASAGNRKTWTWAGWVKLGAIGTVRQIFTARTSGSPYALFYIFSDDKISFADNALNTHTTAAVYRDPSAWYHIQLTVDTTDATAANRVRLWVNGTLQTWASTTAPTQNTDGQVNTATAHSIGSPQPYAGSEYFNGYLADIHFIDGQALTPSSFGETDANGIWQPKAYTGTYGTNGFQLKFADNSSNTATTLGKDTSGNGNNWTPNNLSVTAGAGNDSLVDSPTSYGTDTGAGGEVRGNYATLNPLAAGGGTLSNGNLDLVGPSSVYGSRFATVGVSSGKWYCEATTLTNTSSQGFFCGVTRSFNSSYIGSNSDGYGYHSDSGNKYNNASASSYGASYATDGTVIGIALDLDAGTLTFYKNGVSQGTAYSSLPSGTYYFGISCYNTQTGCFNAGARPFAYTAPSGFKALCTTNLPSTTITTSGSYTGNGVADGPFVYLNGVPTAMTVGGNAVTFGTHADKLSNGFKIRTTSTTYNQNASTYNYTITTTGDPFKRARAQSN
jgi:hypothetical protein